MNRIVIAIGLIALTLAGKEALAQPVIPSAPTQVTVPAEPAPYAGRGEVYGGGYDNRYDNRYDNGYGNGYDNRYQHQNHNRWSYLASVQVNGRDRDVIALGPQAGRYDKLMLVPQGRVWLRHAVVTFMNGENMSVDLRSAYRQDGSIVIDLPGERRAVSHVELYAAGRRWGGGAQVALYGERGSRRGGWWR